MTKRTAKETWDALEAAALDAEMESVLAMTPEERERELTEAGFDLEEVHAQSDAFFEKLQAMPPATPGPAPASEPALAPAPPPAKDLPFTPRTGRLRPAVVISAGLALAASVTLIVQLSTPSLVGSAPPRTPEERALDIRRDARDECRQEHWKDCLDRLDRARALDPKGDSAPDVQALRKTVGEKLGHP